MPRFVSWRSVRRRGSREFFSHVPVFLISFIFTFVFIIFIKNLSVTPFLDHIIATVMGYKSCPNSNKQKGIVTKEKGIVTDEKRIVTKIKCLKLLVHAKFLRI